MTSVKNVIPVFQNPGTSTPFVRLQVILVLDNGRKIRYNFSRPRSMVNEFVTGINKDGEQTKLKYLYFQPMKRSRNFLQADGKIE